ncbi:glycine zipper 2TM domain-containing protein [Trinickia terrae]|uniref:Glycine zipper 2TM domain-containing protein n=1 Tax=Trinickia terrae TaxID=2571161 RepID=A0A4U1HWY7_9BURK|nr:glycine zipper 2TM domain-containing protein [Trinickia terrae]TKC83496.1 glycine zipper 2TM domain-containing protein [Trinickia terrae]
MLRLKRTAIFGVIGTLSALLLLSGCTLGGAAVGGVVGNEVTHHSTAGTIGGAVAGGIVGYELGR